MNYEQFREPTLTEGGREEGPHYEAKELSGGCSKRSLFDYSTCHNPSFSYLSLFFFFFSIALGLHERDKTIPTQPLNSRLPSPPRKNDWLPIHRIATLARIDGFHRSQSLHPVVRGCSARGSRKGESNWDSPFHEKSGSSVSMSGRRGWSTPSKRDVNHDCFFSL